eukprot:CAMPEP_0182916138 /NCGR_PEP_ID=MMETSP0105_2-20130417/762_1 /TAXON_ID=81532 ORGANISM="Acanthoeca-like sp., Strain 10tr" /NCGR_SAMPLE_ID=MMETSP0105_2 /ASSEMBLY_ACC=CAM_ASM_000205 /LENGTH=646 /DNA_ID=CAMNT_0025053067 /DNA_START=32 /DNA_END=1972 /DNA_ORIENTATION=+
MASVDDLLYPEDTERFDSISYNKQSQSELPEYARGKVLNRYGDILPNPKTMVKLSMEDGEPSSTYVNANFVTNWHGQNGWIAAQGPTRRTLPAFVRMLWEHDVKTIVMLTKLKEGEKAKCEPYFPKDRHTALPFESIEVSLQKCERKDGYIVNTLILRRDGEEKIVTQFWYTSWPDHGVPTIDGEIYTREMILLVLTVRAHRKNADKMKTPAVVHCSAGVGRTGAFIAIDQAIDAYKQRVKVDINDVVFNMRQCRMALIQHTAQYSFVWAAARDYIAGKLELKAAKGGGVQAPPAADAESYLPEQVRNANVGDVFRTAEDYDNPERNDGVLLVSAGDTVELVEQSAMWWWMRRANGDEGWVLPDILEPLKPAPPDPAKKPALVHDGKPIPKQKPALPGKKPAVAQKPGANPFANGKAPERTGSANNPFASVAKEDDAIRGRTKSNPFEMDRPPPKSNPFASKDAAELNPFRPSLENDTDGSLPVTPMSGLAGLGDGGLADEIAEINAKVAAMRSASNDNATTKTEDDEPLPSPFTDAVGDAPAAAGAASGVLRAKSPQEEHGTFYSDLQPFTYVSADGVVGTLFNDEHLLKAWRAPDDLPRDMIRTPEQIIGPAVVSHDSTWRLTNNAQAFASALVTAQDDSDTEC